MIDNKISKFDAHYKTEHDGRTTIQHLGQLINNEWIYSMHWKNGLDNHDELMVQIKDSLDTELVYANDRLKQLKLAQAILSDIEI